MIPAEIDAIAILADLKRLGWIDYKIEIACGFSKGYIAQVRHGNVEAMAYQRGARLYNFWFDQMNNVVPCGTEHLPIRTLTETT